MTGLLARTNPLVLVILSILGMLASLAVQDLTTAVVTLGLVMVAGLVGMPARSGPLFRYLAVVLGSVSIAWSTWLVGERDLGVAVVAGLRIVVLALPGVALAPLIDPSALADQLGQRLRLPARGVVAFAAALQRVDHLGDTWRQLVRARRARGVGPGRGPISTVRHAGSVTFGLLVATLRQATRMSVAMDARGFGHAERRSWAEPARWTRLDTAVVLIGVALGAVPYLFILGRGLTG